MNHITDLVDQDTNAKILTEVNDIGEYFRFFNINVDKLRSSLKIHNSFTQIEIQKEIWSFGNKYLKPIEEIRIKISNILRRIHKHTLNFQHKYNFKAKKSLKEELLILDKNIREINPLLKQLINKFHTNYHDIHVQRLNSHINLINITFSLSEKNKIPFILNDLNYQPSRAKTLSRTLSRTRSKTRSRSHSKTKSKKDRRSRIRSLSRINKSV